MAITMCKRGQDYYKNVRKWKNCLNSHNNRFCYPDRRTYIFLIPTISQYTSDLLISKGIPMSLSGKKPESVVVSSNAIARSCIALKEAKTRGELGEQIANLVLTYSPADIQQMKRNFDNKARDLPPEYRDRLTRKITEHLLGTYQQIRLAQQQGTCKTMNEPVDVELVRYWDIVAEQCRDDGSIDGPKIRFLKFLLAGYCMLVQQEPGHPVGMPFPGGDTVELTDGIYYCPVREKAGDVDEAFCPFCPAHQTPEIGYLRPPTNPSEHRKQEFIENCHRFHNFNG